LGQGAGQNWWCVLFPPLCFVEAKKTAPEQEAVVMVADGAEDTPPPLKSRLLEWWHKLFGKNEQNLVFGSISAAAPGR
jgi:stage II sporulation protein R